MATLFGDTAGSLADHQHGRSQILRAEDSTFNELYGDAGQDLVAQARGGDDVLIGRAGTGQTPAPQTVAYGDARHMSGQSHGGNDLFLGGQDANNFFVGDADTMAGRSAGGSDLMFGASGASNEYFGDAYTLGEDARGGRDVLIGGSHSTQTIGVAGFNILSGDCHDMSGRAHGGDDILVAGTGAFSANSLFGDAQFMSGDSRGGDDTLVGAAGPAGTLFEGDGEMAGNARGGDDLLVGGAGAVNNMNGDGDLNENAVGGSDHLIGGGAGAQNYMYGDGYGLGGNSRGGDDVLVAGVGAATNQMFGDGFVAAGGGIIVCGNDTLFSAASTADDMWGDVANKGPGTTIIRGHNTFVFAPGNGHDTIHDFLQGSDEIDLRALASEGVHGFGDLQLAPTAGVTGTVVRFDGADDVTVAGIAELRATDFLFA